MEMSINNTLKERKDFHEKNFFIDCFRLNSVLNFILEK